MEKKLNDIVEKINNLGVSSVKHHHYHHYKPNIPRGGSGVHYPSNSGVNYPGHSGTNYFTRPQSSVSSRTRMEYPGGSGPSYPGGPGRVVYDRSPSPTRREYPPFRPDFERSRRHSGSHHVTHYGPGPHGPGVCPPQCYGWHPPAHCVGNYSWQEGRSGHVPHNAVKVGVDRNGGAIYAGRAFYEGDLIPAKIIPSHGCAYVPWGGREHQRHEYEVLCSVHVGWTTCSGGDIPPEAICIGQTSNGERLYMGRVMHDGTLTPGKIQPSHGVLYIPYDGMEISYRDYEAMVLM